MTNDEGQMRNRWGKLKVSRKWVISLAAVAIGLLLTYALFRKPAVTLEIVELKQELLRGFEPNLSDSRVFHRRTDFELHWVASLELRNNSSSEIQYSGFFSNHNFPEFECLYWTKNVWAGDLGFAADQLAFADYTKREGGGIGGGIWSRVSLRPGEALRFRAEFYDRGKPSFIALSFRTPRSKIKIYDLLPYAVVESLPWRKEWHQAETEVILNGAKETPPRWTSKPDIFDRNQALLPQ